MSSSYFAQFDEPENAAAPADRAFEAPTEDPRLRGYADIFEAGIKREKNKAIYEAFGREVEAHPFFQLDDPSTVVSASLVGGPKEKESVATDAIFPQVRRGIGVASEMLGQGVEQRFGDVAIARGLQSFGERQQENAPDRAVPSIYDIKGIGSFGTWLWEAAQEGVGTSVPAIVGGIAGAPLGPGGVIAGVAATSNMMGVGQIRNALQDERDEYWRRIERAKAEGNVGAQRMFEEEYDKLDPDKNRVIAEVAGGIIGAMDAFTPAALLMRSAPAHLVNELKAKTFRFIAAHVAKRAAQGAGAEGVTEALQAVVEISAVLRAKGVTGAMDHVNNIIDKRWRILDEAAAGMAGGTAFGVIGAAGEVAGTGRGADAPPPQTGAESFFQQFDTPEQRAAAQAPQQPAETPQAPAAPTPAPTTQPEEAVRAYGIPDDLVSGARLDTLYTRNQQLEEILDSRQVNLDLDVEGEDGTTSRQTVTMPARQALDMVDRRLKGMLAFIRCLET